MKRHSRTIRNGQLKERCTLAIVFAVLFGISIWGFFLLAEETIDCKNYPYYYRAYPRNSYNYLGAGFLGYGGYRYGCRRYRYVLPQHCLSGKGFFRKL